MKNIAKALIKFHSLVPNIPKNGKNPFFKSKYASLEDILPAIKDPLKQSGLAFIQLPSSLCEQGVVQPALTTILIEETSGEIIEKTTPLFLKVNDPQGQGSALTYMRRYALVAMLGLNTDEDDDGNACSTQPLQSKPINNNDLTF